jgi:hypothetical protein
MMNLFGLIVLALIFGITIWFIGEEQEKEAERKRQENIDWYNYMVKKYDYFEQIRKADAKRCFSSAKQMTEQLNAKD